MSSINHKWLEILQNAVNQSSVRKVAQQLDYSAATISLVLADKYPGRTNRVAEKVTSRLSLVQCPHDDKTIAKSKCEQLATQPAPSHNPIKMAHWRACQCCPHHPNGENHD